MMLLASGLGLGMFHALDPDHLLAVANLDDARAGCRARLRLCGRWALGHGAVLLAIGALVLLAGMAVPVALSLWAERAVGLVLVLLGVGTLWTLIAGEAPLRLHAHGAAGTHLHLAGLPAHHGRRALLVGALHGTAGSAALLALAPLALAANPWQGLGYLLAFGLGVVAAMLGCGGLLGAGLARLRARTAAFAGARALLALAAMALGLYLLGEGL
jgi:nickel/cobalt transporter (NicO) family protein